MYYRFWKKVGKGNWKKYQERYMRPRSIENSMRLLFPFAPRFKDAKASAQWNWMLPKRIANATTSDGVLNAWAFYRHKRKKVFHYTSTLRRLVEVGGCDVNDWRYKLLTSRLARIQRRFLNLPRVGTYFGKLHDKNMLEEMTPFHIRQMCHYSPQKLSFVVQSYSDALLFDKTLLNRVSQEFSAAIPSAASSDIVRVIEGFARLRYFRSDVVLPCIAELVARVKSKSITAPTFAQLVSIADACGDLKLQPRDLTDLLYVTAFTNLRNDSIVAKKINPILVARLLSSFDKMHLGEAGIFATALVDAADRIHEYPPDALFSILKSSASNIQIFSNEKLTNAALKIVNDWSSQPYFLELADLANAITAVGQLYTLNNATPAYYQVRVYRKAVLRDCLVKMEHMLSRKDKCIHLKDSSDLGGDLAGAYQTLTAIIGTEVSDAAVTVLSRHLYRQIARFDVNDFLTLALGLAERQLLFMQKEKSENSDKKYNYAAHVDEKLVQLVSRCIFQRQEEFTGRELAELSNSFFITNLVEEQVRVRLEGLAKDKGAASSEKSRVFSEAKQREESRNNKALRTHLVGAKKSGVLFEEHGQDKKSATRHTLFKVNRTVFKRAPRRYA